MAWTTPRTWATNELVTAALMNEQLRDNIGYVHNGKPMVRVVRNTGSTYSTTASSFADIDTSNLAATLDVTTGRVVIGLMGTFYASSTAKLLRLDFTIDGTRIGGGGNGLSMELLNGDARTLTLLVPHSGVTPGSHTFRVQWGVDAGGTAYLFQSSSTPVWFFVWQI